MLLLLLKSGILLLLLLLVVTQMQQEQVLPVLRFAEAVRVNVIVIAKSQGFHRFRPVLCMIVID